MNEAVGKSVEWGQAYLDGNDVKDIMAKQILSYLNEASGEQ